MSAYGVISNGMDWIGTHTEAISRSILNGISGKARWGDALYDKMDHAVDAEMDGIVKETHDTAYKKAIASGATPLKAEIAAQQAISAKMKSIIDPQSSGDFCHILSITAKTGVDTVTPTYDILGSLKPLLIGFGLLSSAAVVTNVIAQ